MDDLERLKRENASLRRALNEAIALGGIELGDPGTPRATCSAYAYDCGQPIERVCVALTVYLRRKAREERP